MNHHSITNARPAVCSTEGTCPGLDARQGHSQLDSSSVFGLVSQVNNGRAPAVCKQETGKSFNGNLPFEQKGLENAHDNGYRDRWAQIGMRRREEQLNSFLLYLGLSKLRLQSREEGAQMISD